MAMRVIGGTARSVPLVGPSSEGTRPLTDRAREALFNILGPRMEGAVVLDLFAGTGAVGIEALSRGAARAVLVERDPVALGDIEANLAKTRLGEGAEVVRGDAFHHVRTSRERFDVVYSGPPQWDGLWKEMLTTVDDVADRLLAPDAVVVTQLDPREDEGEPALQRLERVDQRDYGRVRLVFHEPTGSGGSSVA